MLKIDAAHAVRDRQWLEWLLPANAADCTPHLARQQLLADPLFPEKWVNRLFSMGGIRIKDGKLGLLMFPTFDARSHPLFPTASLALHSTSYLLPDVLYEDEYCLVMNKPSGMPVHPSGKGQCGTLDEAALVHVLRNGQSANVRHIHRLDEDTSGPVLYSKNDYAQQRLDEAMRIKAIDRRYAALVQGRMTNREGTIDRPIAKDRHHSSRRRVFAGGDKAVTHYEVLERYHAATLVKIRLETGRTHQIRVHFSAIGHPLVGDKLYGGDTRLLGYQALHGESLRFNHPWTGCVAEIKAPLPQWFMQLQKRLSV